MHLLLGKRACFFPESLAVLVVLTLVLRTDILDGFCQWYKAAGDIYTAGSGITLPALEASNEQAALYLFSAWAGAVAGLCFCALSQWKTLLAAGPVLVLAASSLLLGRMIDPLPIMLTVLILCCKRGWKNKLLSVSMMAGLLLLFSIPALHTWAQMQSEQLCMRIHQHQYETKYTTLPEGRLEALSDSDATALIVTLEKPEVLYLRGFTGAELDDGRWKPLDTAILAENEELLYWLNEMEFDLRAQFESAASILETKENHVTIQNIGACSAYRYIPFTILADDGLISKNLLETVPGSRYDTYTTVYGGAAMVPELVEALTQSDSRYLRSEAAYREFVQEHYLTIPADLAEKMKPYWDKAEGLEAQSAVKAVLESCYPEGPERDPYYATAAVLTLRHFGIPARYAEGYILPQTTQTTVELTGRHAACWAEVYHDGIGWLPMALTPGLEGEQEMEQPLPPDTPEETLPPETEPKTEPEPDGGYQVHIARVLFSGAVIAAIVLLLTVLLLPLRRRHILKKRQAFLDHKDIREAITWSFADAVSVLERMGIHRSNGSLDAMAAPILERFDDAFAKQFDAASRVNAKALFSSKPMTEEERFVIHSFRTSALELLQTNSNRLRRLWMKYVLCLF